MTPSAIALKKLLSQRIDPAPGLLMLSPLEIELLRRSEIELDEYLESSGFSERIEKIKSVWKSGKANPTDILASLLVSQ